VAASSDLEVDAFLEDFLRRIVDISHSLPAAILSLSLSVALFFMLRVSSDFNAPDKEQVFKFMDKAVLESGVNLIDTVST